jgi:F0F1-type ATP synthase assembly protein I
MTQGQEPGRSPGAGAGWAVLGTLIAGMAVWGGIGWLLDRWLSTQAFLPVGVIVGVASSIYLVYIKYGK